MLEITTEKHVSLRIDHTEDHEKIETICHALASPERLKILQYILNRSVNLSSIAEDLDLPISSVSRHIDVLSNAGLIVISYQPGLKGHIKYCAQAILDCKISMNVDKKTSRKNNAFVVEMPIGMYSDFKVRGSCGLVSKSAPLGQLDDPQLFYSPLRAETECLWFNSGYVSYRFPLPSQKQIEKNMIRFSMEVCSDTIYYNNKWPSDITVKINGIEILTFTSPGNFGGRRGKYTPDYWPITSSQFGLLKTISVHNDGVYLDNAFVHGNVVFDDLHIFDNDSISLEIGVKEDAEHKGGLSLFGKNFGDFNQAIIMVVS